MGQSSERFDFGAFDEQMEEALADNEKAMSSFIVKHAQGLNQIEVAAIIEQKFVDHEGTE